MKKTYVLVLWLLSLPLFANPQAALQQKLAGLQQFQANFNQQVTDAQGELLQTTQGKLYLQRPGQLHWQVLPPNETTLIADGQTLWHIDPFVEQVVAMDQQAAVQHNPVVLLTSQQPELWQQYQISQQGEQFTISNDDPQSQIRQLSLQFNGNTLVGLQMLDAQQQLSSLSFSQVQQNQPLDAALFQFSLPAGFELDDQRP